MRVATAALAALGLLLGVWAAGCGADETPAPPQVGERIAPLTGPAASNHAQRVARLCAELGQARFQARTFAGPGGSGSGLRYRLFVPSPLEAGRNYPLVLCLHGGGPRSFDELLRCASPVFAYGPARFVSAEAQARYPALVLVPWSGGRSWDDENERLVLGLLAALRREFRLDPRRFYVTGQSMGGFGAWRLITEHPEVFAAAIPVCGGGDPARAFRARAVAVWAFHGTADGLVPASASRAMIAALIRAGGQPRYWEYEGGTHARTAERAYCEPALLDWLFAQERK